MDGTGDQSGAGTSTNNLPSEMPPGGIGSDGLPVADPRLVEKLVEELKSQGMFDQIRKDCLAEVDTKPAYQNLRSRVSETVQRFLGRQRWNPSLNKNQLRNQLKHHIQQTPFMEDGVERIVEQVVNPKIMSVLEPEVENLICGFFGVEQAKGTGPGLRGDISPLTPERDIEQTEHYSVSAYGQSFTTSGQLPSRGPSGFMPPPPSDHRPSDYSVTMPSGRSSTPQMQGDQGNGYEKQENKDIPRKPKNYTVKDFLNGSGTGMRGTPVKVKKSTEFEELLKKSTELMGGVKKESDLLRKQKERDLSRKHKEKTLRKRKERELLRKHKEMEVSKMYKEGFKRIKEMSPEQEMNEKENNDYNRFPEHIKREFEHAEEENDEGDDSSLLYCICRKEDDGTFMIGCDFCEEWYHPRCLNISNHAAKELENEEWWCPQCEEKKGNVSPLTPPPLTVRPASPRTPPLPPRYSKSLAPNVIQQETVEPPLPPPPIALPPLPQHDTVQLQEEIVAVSYDNTNDSKSGSEMSPVSDTELAEISSPKNMPVPALTSAKPENSRTDEVETPPLPAQEPPLPPEFQQRQDEIAPPPPPPDIDSPAKPPSPLTSPIGSSPDDMEEPGQEPTTACSSQSVMAPDLRTPRQMMQSQYQRAAVRVGPGTFTPGDTQSSVSASDISDTDLPEASGGTMSEDNDQESRSGRKSKDSAEPEDDLEALERAKAELQAKLAATKIGDEEDGVEHDTAMDDSDGEVHTDDSNDYMKRFQEIARGGELQPKPSETDDTNISTQGKKNPTKDESSMSPISSEGPTPEPPKVDKENPEEPETQDDHALEKMYYRKKDEDDDDQPNPSEKHSLRGHSTTTGEYSSSEPRSKVDSNTSQGSSTKDGEKKSKHHSSSSRHSHSSHDHQSKHRHSSTTNPSKERKPSHSSSHQSSKDKKSSHHKSHHESDRHRSSSHSQHDKVKQDRDQEKERRYSTSSSKREGDDKNLTKVDHRDRHDKHIEKKIDKEAKKEMEKKREQKLKSFEEKVNQNYKLKSDKYEAIDMFAPKPLKMPSNSTQRTSTTASPVVTPSSPAVGLKTPPTFESKTPPAFGQGAPTSVFASSSNPFSKDSTNKKKDQDKAKRPSSSNTSSATPPIRIVQRNADKSPTSHKDANSNNDREEVEKIKEQLRKEREKSVATTSPNISSSATDVDPNEKPRKIFPELPVTKCDGDKLEQHKDDYAATKRRLEEARARKMADIYRKKEIERIRRKSNSGSVSTSSSGDKLNVSLNSASLVEDTKAQDLAVAEMELKIMQENRRKKDKEKHREIEKKRKDKDSFGDGGKPREKQESISESDGTHSSPVKRVSGKRKSSSKDTEDTSSSDAEWKECGLKATDGITQIKRVPRNRKRTKRYSSSEDDSELSHSRHQQISINRNNRNDAKNVPEMEEDQSIEALELQLRRQTETADQSHVAQSRSVQQIRADNLLKSDTETFPLDGFRESDVQPDLEKRQWYEDYLAKAEEDLELNVSCNECDIDDSCLPSDFYAKRDFIYICNLSQKSGVPQAWRGAKKVAALLKKMFGGNPKVVHPVPRWLMLKFDRWGLRRHEVELVYEPSKVRNKRIYTEAEYDQMYPENEAVKSRYKRLKLKSLDDILGMQLQKVEDGLSSSKDSQSPITSGKLKRRDTIEKNLDEMFSSDQETELEMKEPKRKRQKHRDSVVSNENLGQKISPPSPIMEPFHGFQEHEANQIKLGAIAKGQTSKGETNLSNFASMPHLTTSLLQVDLNGNTFGMSSVLASPISDFNSDFDGDENHESSEKKRAPCIEEHNRLPMSVQMNYPMVQYLKQALKNDTNVIKELDRLLGSPSIAASFSLKMQEKIIGDTPKGTESLSSLGQTS